jgi:YVTN family beta-propeller protein
VAEFRILGPLEARDNGRALELGGGKQRALLAVLLLRRGQTVSPDLLIDALWGENPPASAQSTVQAYVSRIRRSIGRDRVLRHRGGYELVLAPGELDLDRFQNLFGAGRELLARGDAAQAAEKLRAALDLWRGRPLADFTYEPFAAGEIARLEELRLSALEERIEADLVLGRHNELVPELDALVREHPLRERLRGQLMLALYRSDRQADALETYRQARATLVDELGLEPSPALQQLERRILTHDPELGAPVRRPPAGLRRRTNVLAAAAAAILALAAGAVVLALTRDRGAGEEVPSVGPNTVAVIDSATNRVVDAVPVGTHPAGIAYRRGDVWVANTEDRTVSRIDPQTRAVKGNISVGAPPTDVVFTRGGAIWTGNGSEGTLAEVSPLLRAVGRRVDLSGNGLVRNAVHALAYGAGSLWAATSAKAVIRVDPRTGEILRRISVPATPYAIAYGDGAVWVMTVDNHLRRIEPSTNAITNQQLVGFTEGNSVAVGGGVWVGAHPSLSSSGVVSRLDPDTMRVESSIPVEDPYAIAVGTKAIWVASYADKRVYRIDPDSEQIVDRIPVGGAPAGIAIVDDEVWVTIEEPEF